MAQKAPPTKGEEIKRALVDFVFVVLLVSGAGFGGYFYGTTQKMAPLQNVAPGTPGALPAPPASAATPASPTPAAASTATTADTAKKGKVKYWISSSGADYVGYSITAKVNDTTIDLFVGPGKNNDVTNLVKPGDNGVTFESKLLGSDYNKHQGDPKAVLTVQVIKGPFISENFKPSDVLASYSRSATDTGEEVKTLHFTGE